MCLMLLDSSSGASPCVAQRKEEPMRGQKVDIVDARAVNFGFCMFRLLIGEGEVPGPAPQRALGER